MSFNTMFARLSRWLPTGCLMTMLTAGAVGQEYRYEQLFSFGMTPDSGILSAAALLEGDDGTLFGTTVLGGGAGGGSIFSTWRDGSNFKILRSFSGTDGRRPTAALIKAGDGYLYGTTTWAVTTTNPTGFTNSGTIYRIRPDGSDFQTIKTFAETGEEGMEPGAAVMLASDGMLYGTTPLGGANGVGTVFRMNPDGSNFAVVASFGVGFGDAQTSRGVLVEGPNGDLLGTSELGGVGGAGTIFSLPKSGGVPTVLKNFLLGFEGGRPIAGLTKGSDGLFYGTTSVGGPDGGGAVFAISADGLSFEVLKTFSPAEGSNFFAGVTEAVTGEIYCVSAYGGVAEAGAVFRMNKDGSGFATVRTFTTTVGDPQWSFGAVIVAGDGNLYGTSGRGGQYGVGTVYRMAKDGSGFKVLKSFSNTGVDAIRPQTGVVAATDGFLYGTTQRGGEVGDGTVFRIRPDGSEYGVVHTFGLEARDGRAPLAPLLEASDGLLYGTTSDGGTSDLGTIYRMSKGGAGFEVLHRFGGAPLDGANPFDDVIQGADGYLYGVTFQGGAADQGTVFKLKPDGTQYQVLRSFTGAAGDGAGPASALLQASDGMLYGTTVGGGTAGSGTLFRLKRDGADYSVLVHFPGVTKGPKTPTARLIEGSDGRLYGTSLEGGNNGGTAYAVNRDGSGLVALVAFPTAAGDGIQPNSGVVEDSAGRLWGACYNRGGSGFGSVFSVARDGSSYRQVVSFSGPPDGGLSPVGPLLDFGAEVFYGATVAGGGNNFGSIFRLVGPGAVRIDSFSQIAFGDSRIAAVSAKAPSGWVCHLEAAPTLGAGEWLAVGSTPADFTGTALFTDSFPADAPTRFYRLSATPNRP